ncbi:MAG TPA: PRC-barrel domain-containing protein [Actinomycetota bacterium]|jgi:hypothetical protein|nr:PRC-barrel domain-containing protein [Actinomycetota bacterium]
MPDIETIGTWEGRALLDRDGGRIGIIDAIYLDDRTGEPEWALVDTGLFGTKSSFVPLAQAFQSDDDVVVLYDKQLVRDAPRVDPERHLSEAEERQLWRHYGLDYDTTELRVGTAQRERGRVRLRRYVTTEQVEAQDEDGEIGRHERRRRR